MQAALWKTCTCECWGAAESVGDGQLGMRTTDVRICNEVMKRCGAASLLHGASASSPRLLLPHEAQWKAGWHVAAGALHGVHGLSAATHMVVC
jgi:hypothetical protein